MTRTTIINCNYTDVDTSKTCSGSISYEDGIITAIGDQPPEHNSNTIDAKGRLLIPGLIDCYARLREPGYEKSGTVSSEAKAAVNSAITTIMCAPDTDPVIDEPGTVELIKRRAVNANGINVLPIGAVTIGLKGEQLGEMLTLSESGCVAFSNGDQAIHNTQVLRRIMEYSSGFNLKLIIAPQDPWLSDGVAHEGSVSTRLGLRAIPAAAETVALSQLIELCYQTGASVHFSRLSSHRGVQLVSQAKKDNIRVTADTGIDHLFLTEMDTSDFNSLCHTSPPFRSRRDLEALREGLASGVIDAICSNHAPHELDNKLTPFSESAAGTSSLDCFLGLLLKLADEMQLPLATIIARASSGPAHCFGLKQGRLAVGAPADFCLIDTDAWYELNIVDMHSKGKNSPYHGWDFAGQVEMAVVNGKQVPLDH